ncbi:MAG: hypothetical protein AB7I37_19480 [Pirellulales bacterium]
MAAIKRMTGEPSVYESRSIKPKPSDGTGGSKRKRRTSTELHSVRRELYAILAECHPQTVRQVYYQAVSRGIIDKTEQAYKQTIVRLLGLMRMEKQIPFRWIADNTRWMRKPDTFDSLESCLELTISTYRRAIWNDQESYVEVWLEKDALAGVLIEETSKWDVPLMVTRGFSSKSYLWEAAQTIIDARKPAYLYYFGDRDPRGVHIDRSIERQLREFAPEAEIHFKRMAVTPEQIEELGLPTRPNKKTDSRCKGFEGDSVEVDAIPSVVLREMAYECISQHIDADTRQRTLNTELAERETLKHVRSRFVMAGDDEDDEHLGWAISQMKLSK